MSKALYGNFVSPQPQSAEVYAKAHKINAFIFCLTVQPICFTFYFHPLAIWNPNNIFANSIILSILGVSKLLASGIEKDDTESRFLDVLANI